MFDVAALCDILRFPKGLATPRLALPTLLCSKHFPDTHAGVFVYVVFQRGSCLLTWDYEELRSAISAERAVRSFSTLAPCRDVHVVILGSTTLCSGRAVRVANCSCGFPWVQKVSCIS